MSAEQITFNGDYMFDYDYIGSYESYGCINVTLSEVEAYRYSKGQIVLVTIILPLILSTGMLGNLAFVYVAFRIKLMRTITNRYLVNLSISDVLFLAGAIGDKIWKYTNSPIMGDDSPLGAAGCVWVYFVSDTAYFASLIFVTIVSVDRYFAVCRPHDRNNMIKTKSGRVMLASWIISVLIALVLIPSNANYTVYCFSWPPVEEYNIWKSEFGACMPFIEWIREFATCMQTVPFFITFTLNAYMYVCIIRGLDQGIKRIGQHGVTSKKDRKMRNQIAQMLVVNGVLFFCLLAPFELSSLFQLIASLRGGDTYYTFLVKNDIVRSYMMFFARMLSYLNAAINPLIYTLMSSRYREAFKRAFIPTSLYCHSTNALGESSRYVSTNAGISDRDTIVEEMEETQNL